MDKPIVFEWSDCEAEVLKTLGQSWEADFVPDLFSLDAARGREMISVFVDSKISDDDLRQLVASGTKKIAIRAAGFDMVNVELAKSLGIAVSRVAAYSPESIAEHVFALLLASVRRLRVAYDLDLQGQNTRTQAQLGITLNGKTLGLYGAGRIGQLVAKIATGFGMQVMYVDPFLKDFPGAVKVESLVELVKQVDVLSVHVPLNDQTRYSVNAQILEQAKMGMYLVNTARADIVDSNAVVAALDSGRLAGLGVDVWDSGEVNDLFDKRLIRPNAVQTNHVAFLTYEAVGQILKQTISNLAGSGDSANQL